LESGERTTVGPEFWERRNRRLRARDRLAILFYLQVLPPLCAVVGACLVVQAVIGPRTPDRATMMAIGVLAFLAGSAGTGVVLYVRRLVRRLRPPEG
jgi:hypothetical protein